MVERLTLRGGRFYRLVETNEVFPSVTTVLSGWFLFGLCFYSADTFIHSDWEALHSEMGGENGGGQVQRVS